MPRPMHGKPGEKPKNFKESIIRLFNSLNSFKYLVLLFLSKRYWDNWRLGFI